MSAVSTAPPLESRVRADVERELECFFTDRVADAAVYGEDVVELWQLAAHSVLGGKLVRPRLLIDIYHALQTSTPAVRGDGASIPAIDISGSASDTPSMATIVRIASAIELLHYSFLLHDDVIDGDLVRRGQSNLIGALVESAHRTALATASGPAPRPEQTLHWARAGGILMGDLLLASTHQTFARAPLPYATRERLLDVLDKAITESVAGEYLDVGLGDGVFAADLDTILRMCGYKTAAYTFELPLLAAAALAGANPQLERALALAGRHLGLAFQLQDDLLSTFGDHAEHGKDPFSDLREGKQTALIAYARMTSGWSEIAEHLGTPNLSVDAARRLRDLLAECGADRFVQGLIDAQLRAFHSAVGALSSDAPPRVAEVLTRLAAQLTGRRS